MNRILQDALEGGAHDLRDLDGRGLPGALELTTEEGLESERTRKRPLRHVGRRLQTSTCLFLIFTSLLKIDKAIILRGNRRAQHRFTR